MYCLIMIEDNKAQLCTARLFETAEDAAEASAKSWEGAALACRWFGGVSTNNDEGRPLAMWGNAYPKPVHVGARVLPLPEPAASWRRRRHGPPPLSSPRTQRRREGLSTRAHWAWPSGSCWSMTSRDIW